MPYTSGPIYPPIHGTYVIGIGHKARHGKDSAGATLIQLANRTEPAQVAMKLAFADDLRAVCRVIYGMHKKDAPLLQKVGVTLRGNDPDVWVRSVYYKLDELRPALAIITDVRFPNETRFVKQLNGTLIKVSRQNEDGTPFVCDDRDPNHESETALDNYVWDYEFVNRTGEFSLFIAELANFYDYHHNHWRARSRQW